jgi:hypothetical protein
MLVGSLQAAVIIDNTTLNGSFESGTPSDGDTSFANWTTGFNAEANQIRSNLPASDGTYSAVIGEQSSVNGTATLGLLQNTGYTVASGDTFDFSFQWRAAFNWDADDTLSWRLFTTDDNTVGGTLTEIAGSSFTGTSTSYALKSFDGIGSVVAANEGQQLFVEIWGADLGTDTDGVFSRLDEVSLTAVPEPSAAALIGLGGLALILRRRK